MNIPPCADTINPPRTAIDWINAGFRHILPLVPGTKRPPHGNWQKAALPYPHYPQGGLGLRHDETVMIDVDLEDAEAVDAVCKAAVRHFGLAPVRTGRAPRVAILYRAGDGVTAWKIGAVEVRCGSGKQTVVDGVHPDTRRPYTWDRHPCDIGIDGIPIIERDALDAFAAEVAGLLGTEAIAPGTGPSQQVQDPEHLQAPGDPATRRALIVGWFDAVPNTVEKGRSRDDMIRAFAAAIGAAGPELDGDPDIRDAAIAWADQWAPHNHADHARDFDSLLGRVRTAGWSHLRAVLREQAEAGCARADDLIGLEVRTIFSPVPRIGGTPPPQSLAFQQAPALAWVDGAALPNEPPPPPQEWVLEGLIPKGELVLLTGGAGGGKSFLALEIAAHVCSGRSFGGRAVQQGGVVALFAEDSRAQTVRRTRAIEYSLSLPSSVWAGATWLPRDAMTGGPELFIEGRDGRVSPTPLWRAFADRARQARPAMIIVDNANTVFAGDHNRMASVGAFLNHLEALARETGAAVVLVHHPNKSGDSAMAGSAAYTNRPRAVLQLNGEPASNIAKLELIKCNVGPIGVILPFTRLGNGVLAPHVASGNAPVTQATLDAQIDAAILAELRLIETSNSYVSPAKQSAEYAPPILRVSGSLATLGPPSESEIEDGLRRLLGTNKIRIEPALKTPGNRRGVRAYRVV